MTSKPPPLPRLVPKAAPVELDVVSLPSDGLAIGRGADNDWVLPDPQVSRYHARISRDAEGWWLQDLQSANGTWINGRRLADQPRALRSGDRIKLGATEVVFDDPAATVVATPSLGLRVDEARGEVWLQGQPLTLTAKEYALLAFLWRADEALCSRQEIAEAVWPEYQGAVADTNIENLIGRLRHKIEPDPAQPRCLLTVKGRGYRLLRST